MSLEKELSIPSNAIPLPKSSSITSQNTNYILTVKRNENSSSISEIKLDASTSLRNNTTEPKCLLIGRAADISDIRLDHKSISRKHAVLYYVKNDKGLQLVLMDLGGKKGSKVNDELMVSKSIRILVDGDKLQFGNCEIVLIVNRTEKIEEDDRHDNINDNLAEEENSGMASTRMDREREIAAAISSLDTLPTYNKFENNSIEEENVMAGDNTTTVPDLPISYSVTIDANKPKKVTCLAIDPSGARFLSGSTSDEMNMFDFGGMDSTHRPFKQVQVDEGYSLVDIAFSPSGDKAIIATSSATPKVLDRDGNEIKHFCKGDVYVQDMTHTSGHVHVVTSCCFHPFKKDFMLTSSMDGSVRTWDLKYKTAFGKLTSYQVFRIKGKNGKKTSAMISTYHPSGRFFAVGTSCGSIQIFRESSLNRPHQALWDDHDHSSITCLTFNMHGNKLASRALDDHRLNIYQVNSSVFKIKLVATISNVPNSHDRAGCTFSPKGEHIVLGTHNTSTGISKLQVYHLNNTPTSLVWESTLAQSKIPLQLFWHPKLNQIFLTLSNGQIQIYYDPTLSSKGILLTSARPSRQPNELELLLQSRASKAVPYQNQIINPLTLRDKRKNREPEIIDDTDIAKTIQQSQYDVVNKEDRQKFIPEKPAPKGIKTGGSTSSGYNFTQMIVSNQIQKTKHLSNKCDPREELFRYSEGKNYGTVMAGSLAEKTVEQEEEEMKKRKKTS